MTRQTRHRVIVVSTLSALVAAEVALNWWAGPTGQVVVENAGPEPIESLVVTLGGSRVVVPGVAPGASESVFLDGSGPQTLGLSYRQRGNPLGNYQLQGFDPAWMRREGFRLVLKVRPGEVERYQEEAEPDTLAGRSLKGLWRRVLDALGVEPEPLVK